MVRFLVLILMIISNNSFSQDTIIKEAINPGFKLVPAPFKIKNCDTIRIKNIEGFALISLNISDKAKVNSFNIYFLNVVDHSNDKRIKYANRTRDKLLFDEYPKNIRPYYGIFKEFVDSLVIEKHPNAKQDSVYHMYVRAIIRPIEDKIEDELTKRCHKCY